MNRSAAREETFKLLYSLEIQKENLKEQIDIYLENAEISDEKTKVYINNMVEGIESNIIEIEKKIIEQKENGNSSQSNQIVINNLKSF